MYARIQERYFFIWNFSLEFYGRMIAICQLYKQVYFLFVYVP